MNELVDGQCEGEATMWSPRSWWRKRSERRSRPDTAETNRLRPLREFVYLDEVSLRSLLVSQNDTIPEQVTQAMSIAEQAELSATVKADALALKSDVGSRYQTTNSSSVQSSRKAIVQTLFNEFHAGATVEYGIREVAGLVMPAASIGDLQSMPSDLVRSADELGRGSLIEISVKLDVDPVFKLGTMVDEFSAMARDFPDLAGPRGLAVLQEVQPLSKIIDRLLAGLIPIRATALNYCVVEISGDEYVVRRELIDALGIQSRPLVVVGVTEHVGYWKDIRRVLFSGGEFTVLCRLSRSGLHDSWTAVKLADLFSDVSPTLVDQVNSIGRTSVSPATEPVGGSSVLQAALRIYLDELRALTGTRADLSIGELEDLVADVGHQVSPTGQKRVFSAARDVITVRDPALRISDADDLRARQRAREVTGLGLFSGQLRTSETGSSDKPELFDTGRLLDVEVIALYW